MSTPTDILAPAEQTEGTRSQLLRWLKRVGERVEENEPLIELETDKVTVEVAAPRSGVLIEVFKHEQDEISPGELLGRIAPADAAGAAAAGAGGRSASAAGAPSPPGEAFASLDAPVERLAMPDIPSPHSPVLLEAAVPDVTHIARAIQRVASL